MISRLWQRLIAWLRGGRVVAEVQIGRQPKTCWIYSNPQGNRSSSFFRIPAPSRHPDVLTCYTCLGSYIRRPSERERPLHICRGCGGPVVHSVPSLPSPGCDFRGVPAEPLPNARPSQPGRHPDTESCDQAPAGARSGLS